MLAATVERSELDQDGMKLKSKLEQKSGESHKVTNIGRNNDFGLCQ